MMQEKLELERTWVALDTALHGVYEWAERNHRCLFVPRDAGEMLSIERDPMTSNLRVSVCRRKREAAAWVIQFNSEADNVSGISDNTGKPARQKAISTLNDALWHFHRLAVEDAASVYRN